MHQPPKIRRHCTARKSRSVKIVLYILMMWRGICGEGVRDNYVMAVMQTKQTPHVGTMMFSCWASISDVGPTFKTLLFQRVEFDGNAWESAFKKLIT